MPPGSRFLKRHGLPMSDEGETANEAEHRKRRSHAGLGHRPDTGLGRDRDRAATRGTGADQDRHRHLPDRPRRCAVRNPGTQLGRNPRREPQRRKGSGTLQPDRLRRRQDRSEIRRRSRLNRTAGDGISQPRAARQRGRRARLCLLRQLPRHRAGGRGIAEAHRARRGTGTSQHRRRRGPRRRNTRWRNSRTFRSIPASTRTTPGDRIPGGTSTSR